MKIFFNNKFELIVGQNFNLNEIKFQNIFAFLLPPKVVMIDGLYFFSRTAPTIKRSPPQNKMEYEFDVNKIRIDDIVTTGVSNSEAFWCGLYFIKNLIRELRNSFGSDFEIVFSYDYDHCFITFYKIRGDISTLMSKDLEAFKFEAIMKVII